MARGEHFFVWRQQKGVPFQHHAIDLGDGTVVHFTDGNSGVAGPGFGGAAGSSAEFEIQRTAFDRICPSPQNQTQKPGQHSGQDSVHVVKHRDPIAADVIVERALSQVGRRGYHLLFDNCEHFACWCVVGRDESRQVSLLCERLGSASVKTVAMGTAKIASRVGSKQLLRGASPWILAADAAQWATEAGGHHIGLRDPKQRRRAGRAIGMATAVGVGAFAGPVGMAVSGGLWVVGEVAGELSKASFDRLRSRRQACTGPLVST